MKKILLISLLFLSGCAHVHRDWDCSINECYEYFGNLCLEGSYKFNECHEIDWWWER